MNTTEYKSLQINTAMTTNIKEMSYAQIEEQIRILTDERENRKQQEIENLRLHVAHVKESMNLLKEMGIDPKTIVSLPFTNEISEDVDGASATEPVEIDVVEEDTDTFDRDYESVDTEQLKEEVAEDVEKTDVDSPEPEFLPPFYKIWEELSSTDEEKREETCTSSKRHKMTTLLAPFYELWAKIKPKKKKGNKKEEDAETIEETIRNKPRNNNLITPFYELFTDSPIKKIVKIGNEKFRITYPDPEEGRIMSADGICCTLTRMHSDFLIYIPPRVEDDANPEIMDKAA